MRYEYKRVDVSTLDGLKKAERLQENGWKLISCGLFSDLFERKIERIERKNIQQPRGKK